MHCHLQHQCPEHSLCHSHHHHHHHLPFPHQPSISTTPCAASPPSALSPAPSSPPSPSTALALLSFLPATVHVASATPSPTSSAPSTPWPPHLWAAAFPKPVQKGLSLGAAFASVTVVAGGSHCSVEAPPGSPSGPGFGPGARTDFRKWSEPGRVVLRVSGSRGAPHILELGKLMLAPSYTTLRQHGP